MKKEDKEIEGGEEIHLYILELYIHVREVHGWPVIVSTTTISICRATRFVTYSNLPCGSEHRMTKACEWLNLGLIHSG